jgi:hypothetical protein
MGNHKKIEVSGWTRIPYPHFAADMRMVKNYLRRDLVFQTADTREFTGASVDTREKVVCYEDDGEVICVPRGYAPRLEKHLQPYSAAISWMDCRPRGKEVSWKMTTSLIRKEGKDQEAAVKEMTHYDGGILVAAPGKGKCHGRGTPVLMFNGMLKPVELISEGDLLMGPDSRPRTVLSLGAGRGFMYRVIPVKGEPFTCNGDHILTLRASLSEEACKSRRFKSIRARETVEISVKDYLKKSGTFKHRYKLYRVPIEFPENHCPRPIDPYFVRQTLKLCWKLSGKLINGVYLFVRRNRKEMRPAPIS